MLSFSKSEALLYPLLQIINEFTPHVTVLQRGHAATIIDRTSSHPGNAKRMASLRLYLVADILRALREKNNGVTIQGLLLRALRNLFSEGTSFLTRYAMSDSDSPLQKDLSRTS
jgi:hypothetical protein